MNWTKIVTALIYVFTPLTALALNFPDLILVVILLAILLVVARDAEYRAGAINPKAYDAEYLATLRRNSESIFLEGCYITVMQSKKGLVYAVVRPGYDKPVSTGESLAEAAANAIDAISKE